MADPEPLVGLRAHEAVLQRLGSPAARSPSRPPALRRGSDVDRGGSPRVSWASISAAARARRARSIGRSAGASRRSTRRHSGDRRGEAGRDEVGERARERRALELAARTTSSSTTSGDPAERSATRTTIEADGRSPSIPRSARRSRGARAALVSYARAAGASRIRPSGRWCFAAIGCSGAALRATSAARTRRSSRSAARCAGMARRASAARSITPSGAATRPSQRSRDSRARGWRRSGSARSLARGPGTCSARSAMPGRPSRIRRASRASSASTSSPGRSASRAPAHRARPPRAVDGSVGLSAEDQRRLRAGDDPVEGLVDEAGHAHAGAAPDDHRGRRPRRGRGDGVDDPCELRLPADEPATDHATRHGRHCRVALVASRRRGPRGGFGVGSPRARRRLTTASRRRRAVAGHPAGVRWPGERAPSPTPSGLQRAPRRGGCTSRSRCGHGLPVRARPCLRRAHGANKPPRLMAPDPVLQPHRRARPRPVRGRRRHAARRRDRPRPAAGARHRARPRWAAFAGTSRRLSRARRRRSPAGGPRRRRPGGPRLRPSGIQLREERLIGRSSRPSRRRPSTSSPPTPYNVSCR